jgi:hypothetical protein
MELTQYHVKVRLGNNSVEHLGSATRELVWLITRKQTIQHYN